MLCDRLPTPSTPFREILYATPVLALALLIPSCSAADRAEIPSEPAGSLSLSLASNEYRFIGRVDVLDAAGEIAASVNAAADSAPTHLVPVLAGEYELGVPDGYFCTYTGVRAGFLGCSFRGATPRPFAVAAGETTFVLLEVAFHFAADQDVIVAFRTGTAELGLSPRDEAAPRCGAGAGCSGDSVCANIDGAEPRCHRPCNSDADCGGRSACALFRLPGAEENARSLQLCLAPLLEGEDITPPTLHSASLTPTSIDTTLGDATVHMQFNVSDDLSGINYVQATFYSASGQARYCSVSAASLGVTSANLECDAVFPAFGEGGDWSIHYSFADAVGNYRSISTEDALAAGLPSAITVTANQDITPPTLHSASLTPTSIDTTLGDAPVHMQFSISDDLSGINYVQATFYSASGQARYCSVSAASLGVTSANLECDAVFPAFGEGGDWSIHYSFADVVGNYRSISAEDALAAGLPSAITVTANQDITPPTLHSASLTPTSIDTTLGDATVHMQFNVSDDLSGINYVQATFYSASGQARYCSVSAASLGVTSANLECDAVFPAFGEGGDWSIHYSFADVVGNYRSISAEDALAAGLPSILSVN